MSTDTRDWTDGPHGDLEITITGMTCASCANRVERKLNRLDGVVATVNYATEKAKVHYPVTVSPDDLVAMIRNVGRSCRRFLLLDLVRHRLPLVLFRTFAPLVVPPLNVTDGCQSIRRSYTPPELRTHIERALHGTAATFRHTVTPFSIRQIADIRY